MADRLDDLGARPYKVPSIVDEKVYSSKNALEIEVDGMMYSKREGKNMCTCVMVIKIHDKIPHFSLLNVKTPFLNRRPHTMDCVGQVEKKEKRNCEG